MVGVEDDWRRRLPFELSLANQAAKADNLGELLVAFEAADNFFVSRFGRLARELGVEFRQFFFDPLQSRFELSCRVSHAIIIRGQFDCGKVAAAGVAALQKALPKCKIVWDGGEKK